LESLAEEDRENPQIINVNRSTGCRQAQWAGEISWALIEQGLPPLWLSGIALRAMVILAAAKEDNAN